MADETDELFIDTELTVIKATVLQMEIALLRDILTILEDGFTKCLSSFLHNIMYSHPCVSVWLMSFYP